MTNVYYEPATYGLEQVGEVEFSSGSYEFDLLTVWRRPRTGELLYAEDSGCSCPTPFEGHLLDDSGDPLAALTPATKHQIAERLQVRLAERLAYLRSLYYSDDDSPEADGDYHHSRSQVAELTGRLMAVSA